MRTISCSFVALALALTGLTSGCGGDGHTILEQFEGGGPLDPGEARMSGSFGGGSFNPRYAWSDRLVTTTNGYEFGVVLLSADPDTCTGLQETTPMLDFGARFVLMQVAEVTSSVDAPDQPGDFQIEGSSGPVAFVGYYEITDSPTCDFAETIDLTTGTLHLDVASGDLFAGSFDGATAGGNDVQGEFNPNTCALSDFFNNGFACQ